MFYKTLKYFKMVGLIISFCPTIEISSSVVLLPSFWINHVLVLEQDCRMLKGHVLEIKN